MKENEGEVPSYYVSNSHPYIIRPDEWELVQGKIQRRKNIKGKYSGIFASRLVCGDCGAFYGSKVWHSNSKYRRVVWQCNSKFKGEKKCTTPHLTEDEIKARFMTAYNNLILDKEKLLDDCRAMQAALTDCSAIDTEMEKLLQEMEVVKELIRKCVEDNSRHAQDQEEYSRRYKNYVVQYETAKSRAEKLEEQELERRVKANSMNGFMMALSESDGGISEFDPKLWSALVDTVTIHHDGRLVFRFMNGIEVER